MSIKKLSFKGDTKKRKRAAPYDTEKRSSSVAKTSTKSATDDNEDVWTNASQEFDLNGPVVISFTYDTGHPVALSSDTRGSIFTLPLPTSLEPSEVRQVFILTQVPTGIKNPIEREYSLKSGCCGKYLGTDRFGAMTCDSDAIAEQYRWKVHHRPDGWALQSVFDTYLSIQPTKSSKLKLDTDNQDDGAVKEAGEEGGGQGAGERGRGGGGLEVRCDVSEIGFCETFTLLSQPQHRLTDPSNPHSSHNAKFRPSSTSELEKKVGRKLSAEEVAELRKAERDGALGEAVLDMRVKSRSDKFG